MRRRTRPLAAGLTLLCLVWGATNLSALSPKRFRWDIVSVDASLVLRPGAEGTAVAVDGSKMVITGSGTFRQDAPEDVTGGGDWTRFDPNGTAIGAGTYTVTELVKFVVAPGTLPSTFTDTIDKNKDARSGLGHFRISYSDGGEGILIVSCHLPEGTPDSIVEGINVSQGFTNFFTPVSTITVYHVD